MKITSPILGWMLVLGLFVSGCEAPVAKTDAMSLFFKANTAYKSGDYEGALKIYEQMTGSGYASAAVYYNIGNCYMKRNQIGRAVLWYERARRVTPRDGDLQANWTFAKSMIKNPEVPAKKDLAQYVFIHLPYVTDEEIVLVICFLLLLISALILAGLYLRWRFKKTLVLVISLTALLAFHICALVLKLKDYNNDAIILAAAEVRYEPEDKATTHFTAYEGWKVRVLKENTGWTKIERPDGLQGWIETEHLEKI